MQNVNHFTHHFRRVRSFAASAPVLLARLLLLLVGIAPGIALAGTTGGGGQMPWDSGMANFVSDFTGRTAFEFTVAALVVGGITLIWARDHDWSAAFQKVLWVVVIGSLILFSSQALSYLLGYGAIV